MVRLKQSDYEKLAKRLDAIPNGFPRFERGLELKILAKIYTPEEAALASEMRARFCLQFSPFEGAFDDNPNIRVITKEGALRILRETEEAGLIHSSANIREGHFYMCNCCTCCCGFMRGLHQLGIENSVAKSDFYATVDPELCTGCETCVERCQLGAPSIKDDISHVDQKRCVGCGQCVMTCPSEARTLVRKPEDQIMPTPQNMQEWMMKRAENRGISLQEIL